MKIFTCVLDLFKASHQTDGNKWFTSDRQQVVHIRQTASGSHQIDRQQVAHIGQTASGSQKNIMRITPYIRERDVPSGDVSCESRDVQVCVK